MACRTSRACSSRSNDRSSRNCVSVLIERPFSAAAFTSFFFSDGGHRNPTCSPGPLSSFGGRPTRPLVSAFATVMVPPDLSRSVYAYINIPCQQDETRKFYAGNNGTGQEP